MSQKHTEIRAIEKMAEIETLLAARRQAVWQKFTCAGEHKGTWFKVIDAIDARIRSLERHVKDALGVGEYKSKRGLTK